MNLAIDIGNTRTKAAVFYGGNLVKHQEWTNDMAPDFFEYATNQAVQNIILSNVAGPVSSEISGKLQHHFHFFELHPTTPVPISNQYQTPATLGKDRLAAVAGAYALFPGRDCMIVDAGTCITFDWLTADGAYLGGNIAPGLNMRLEAMHKFTARLPLVTPDVEQERIGVTTISAMRNGAQEGMQLEIEGYRQWSIAKFGSIQVLLTGGDADFFANKLKSEIFVNQNLVLLGLNKILEYNVKSLE
ncbi:MAG: type III pantothenate kinase [Phaeodactylibacter sp.]|nr:type III pantothenate kinase [Phaeodactylibacter sp.]